MFSLEAFYPTVDKCTRGLIILGDVRSATLGFQDGQRNRFRNADGLAAQVQAAIRGKAPVMVYRAAQEIVSHHQTINESY